jgi:hypothetical protein
MIAEIVYSQNMAEQKERFMTNGKFTDGPCGSPFCKAGCHDNGSGKGAVDPTVIWPAVFESLDGSGSKEERAKAAGAEALRQFVAQTSLKPN